MEIGIQQVPVDLIDRDKTQPRTEFDEEALQELARSIETNGLLVPISLRKNSGDRFVIIAGERRFRAVKSLGWLEVPAIIHKVSAVQHRKLQLIENLVREQLNSVETARAYKQMMDEGMATKEIAEALGQDTGNVSYYIRLLDCCPEVLALVAKGQLSIIVAHMIANLTRNGQFRALRTFQLRVFNVAEMLAICDRIYGEEHQQPMPSMGELSPLELKTQRAFEKAFNNLYRQFGRLEKLEKVKPGSAGGVKLLRAHIKEMESKLRWLDKILMKKEIKNEDSDYAGR